jgi:hypothetical protein
MWSMFVHTAALFLKGKLFRDPMHVFRQSCIGVAIGMILFVVLAKVGLPIWVAAGLAAFATGAAQPYLFKDLKYN